MSPVIRWIRASASDSDGTRDSPRAELDEVGAERNRAFRRGIGNPRCQGGRRDPRAPCRAARRPARVAHGSRRGAAKAAVAHTRANREARWPRAESQWSSESDGEAREVSSRVSQVRRFRRPLEAGRWWHGGILRTRPGGETGRRSRLKISWGKPRAGSNPAPGIGLTEGARCGVLRLQHHYIILRSSSVVERAGIHPLSCLTRPPRSISERS